MKSLSRWLGQHRGTDPPRHSHWAKVHHALTYTFEPNRIDPMMAAQIIDGLVNVGGQRSILIQLVPHTSRGSHSPVCLLELGPDVNATIHHLSIKVKS